MCDFVFDLFRGQIGETFVVLQAEKKEGKLTISGQDFGVLPEKAFGDSEYEYYYSLNEKDTERFFQIFDLNKFEREFSNGDACKKFREVCQKNGFEYDFCSF